MDKILELTSVVNKHKVKHIEVLGNLPPRKTKVQEFYDKLCEGRFSSDEEAAQYFYQASPDDRRYKVLKKRLMERLYNTVLFIDVQQSKYDDYAKAYYTCWKDYASAKALAGRSAITNAYPLMKKVLKQAIRFDFLELVLDSTKVLRMHYGTHHLDLKKFEYYNELYKTYKERYDAEALAEELYSATLLGFYKMNKLNRQDVYERAQTYIAQLEPLVRKFDSYKLNLCFYLTKLTAANSLELNAEAIDICEEAIDFFQTNPKFPKRAVSIFSRQLFVLYWQDKQYEKGEALLSQAEQYTIEGSIGWFTNYDYFFLLCMHTEKYQRAFEIFNIVTKHKRFKMIPGYDQERWKIYEAYIAYLIGIEKIEVPEKKKFRINKFLNEVPTFSSDKRSRNVPVLIIQILFLLLYKRYDKAIDKMEAVNLYCKRYLKKDDTFRSNCFIKMLLKIIDANFHKMGAIRKAESLNQKLESVPLEFAKQVYETEIIPYERLWELALDSLDNKLWKAS